MRANVLKTQLQTAGTNFEKLRGFSERKRTIEILLKGLGWQVYFQENWGLFCKSGTTDRAPLV
jgi:hypothetical protein